MKFIEKRKFGQDKDIKIPIFAINNREVELLSALLTRARQILPRVLVPDFARIRSMQKTLADYLNKEKC